MGKLKGMMLGALAGSLAASALAFLNNRQTLMNKFRNQKQDWAGKAKNVRENLFGDIRNLTESRRSRNRNIFLRGTVLGLLIGASSAALLTPKTGKQLRKGLTEKYQGVADKTHDIAEFINKKRYSVPLRQLSKAISKKKTKR